MEGVVEEVGDLPEEMRKKDGAGRRSGIKGPDSNPQRQPHRDIMCDVDAIYPSIINLQEKKTDFVGPYTSMHHRVVSKFWSHK